MIASRLLRPLVVLAVTAGVLGAGSALAARPAPVKLGPNLVVNASFEESSNDTATANGIPVLPVGWTVEGATIVFDYNQRIGRTGKRNVAISGSLAPGKQVCDASTGAYVCQPNPAAGVTGQVNDASMGVFSVRPFWVTEKALPVTAGKTYRFSMYSIRPSLDPNAGVVGEGAASKVRWLTASGALVSVVDGSSALKGAKRELGFRLSTIDLVAPAGAAGAELLLGHSDYTVTSAQIAFDDIFFAEVLKR